MTTTNGLQNRVLTWGPQTRETFSDPRPKPPPVLTWNSPRSEPPPDESLRAGLAAQAPTQVTPGSGLASVIAARTGGRRVDVPPEFREIARELRQERKADASTLRGRLQDEVPAGIVSDPADIARLRELTAALAEVDPALPADQRFGRGTQVLRVMQTDFAQTEVVGLRPAGNVIQVLDGTTRANYSQFTQPDGTRLNAVEIGVLTPGTSGARVDVSGLYGFRAVEPELSPKELVTLTRATRKAIALITRRDAAADAGRATGPRPAERLNAFVAAISGRDREAFDRFLNLPGLDAAEKSALREGLGNFNQAERDVFRRIGRVIDLNTTLGPVAGAVPQVGVGFQQVLSSEGNRPGAQVVFQSGSTFNLEGTLVAGRGEKPGDPGYAYTFVAERVAIGR